MYLKETISISGAEKIGNAVQECNAKFHQTYELLQLILVKEFELKVNISKDSRKPEASVFLSGVGEAAIILQCAINELEDVLRMGKSLSEMTEAFKKALNQPPNT